MHYVNDAGCNPVAYLICRVQIWIRVGFSEPVYSVRESSFDVDSLAKPEVLSSRMTSRRHH